MILRARERKYNDDTLAISSLLDGVVRADQNGTEIVDVGQGWPRHHHISRSTEEPVTVVIGQGGGEPWREAARLETN